MAKLNLRKYTSIIWELQSIKKKKSVNDAKFGIRRGKLHIPICKTEEGLSETRVDTERKYLTCEVHELHIQTVLDY